MARDAQPRTYELDELLVRPGTYFNPHTDVLVVVDDSAELDGDIFNMERFEGASWVLISDETPIEEQTRDELLEHFQVNYHPDVAPSVTDDGAEHDDEVEEEDELEEDDVPELGQEPDQQD